MLSCGAMKDKPRSVFQVISKKLLNDVLTSHYQGRVSHSWSGNRQPGSCTFINPGSEKNIIIG